MIWGVPWSQSMQQSQCSSQIERMRGECQNDRVEDRTNFLPAVISQYIFST